ncbi:MAG: hypothetical protein IPJ34_16445 [Myxococcales bacterium]|nr:hypothetical protein [Myxococcales bacterium]
MSFRSILGVVAVSTCMLPVACSSDDGGTPTTDSGVDTGADTGPLDPLAVPCTDTKDAVYGAPGALPADKGAILKCSPADTIAKAALQAKVDGIGYKGKALTSGYRSYRILYRTERGTKTPSAGYTSAMVFLPDTPRAAKLPLVLFGRGSRGQAAKCAPSRLEPEGAYVQGDYDAAVLPLVGAGYAVIAPDLSGYANFGAADNPVAAYGNANDSGKALLDGSRALRKLVPSILSDKVVLVGHSQGGHVALSGAALSGTYGVDGTLAGVALYAPLWLAQRTWGALLLLADVYPIATEPTPNAVSIWYHYTTSELLDGPGHGGDVFKADKRAAIKTFVESDCWAKNYPKLEALGTKATDLFDPRSTRPSPTPPPPARRAHRRPGQDPLRDLAGPLQGRPSSLSAVKAPVLFMYGASDTTIPPQRVTCADRHDGEGRRQAHLLRRPRPGPRRHRPRQVELRRRLDRQRRPRRDRPGGLRKGQGSDPRHRRQARHLRPDSPERLSSPGRRRTPRPSTGRDYRPIVCGSKVVAL